MCQDMGRDVELLNDLLNSAPVVQDRLTGRTVVISAKVLAGWSGRSVQSVSDYRIGRTNIPVEFWRSILARFYDLHIVSLIMPDNINFETTTTDYADPLPVKDLFRAAVEAEIVHYGKMKYVAEIIADGQIDELDTLTIKEYRSAFYAHRVRDMQLFRSITARFEASVARRCNA